ncbi:ABC transporter permease [Parabacteroides sp. OttesenSCG-928-K15]|nr:ABC transporter permease [Parabacteroides sp. OttesenSCG-928-K15]
MIQHYVKVALRQIGKNKVQYFLSIIGIALGLLCFSMTNYFMHRHFSQYTVWPNADRMATVSTSYEKKGSLSNYFPGKELQALIENPVPGIEKVAVITRMERANLTYIIDEKQEIPYKHNLIRVNADFLDVYSITLKSGKSPLGNPNQVMISESIAKKVFKESNPIGKTLYYNRAESDQSAIIYYTITGVFHDTPYPINDWTVDILMPVSENYINPNSYYYNEVTLMLAQGISPAEAEQRLTTQLPVTEEEEQRRFEVKTLPMQMTEGENIVMLILIPIIGSLVLLAALINMLKFCIQSFYNRTHELSLRKSIGATSWSLFLLLFAEICLLLFISALTTYCLAELFLPVFYSYLPPDMYRGMGLIETSALYRQMLYYIVALILLCSLIAWIAIQRIKHISLIEGIRTNQSKHGFRNFMLGFQIFICFLFIGGGIGMTLLFQQLEDERYYTLNDRECKDIWYVQLRDVQFRGQEKQIVSHIRNIPEVEEVVYYEYIYTNTATLSETNKQRILQHRSDAHLAELLKFPIRGRMPENENEVVVSRFLMEEIEKDSINNGTSVLIGDKLCQITGTFDNWPFLPIPEKCGGPEASQFRFIALTGISADQNLPFYVKCAAGQSKKVKKEILAVIREWLPPTIPFEMETLYDRNFSWNGGGKMISHLFLLLAAITILITILGIYSAITLDTRGRQKEVAVRKINGAGTKDISRLFGKLYLRLVIVSAVVAIPLVYIFLRATVNREVAWFKNPLYWLAIILFVALIVFTTVAWQIRKITRINPAEIIKTE